MENLRGRTVVVVEIAGEVKNENSYREKCIIIYVLK